MTEKELESRLCQELRCVDGERGRLASLRFVRSTSDAASISDLFGNFDYDVIQDDSRWRNTPPDVMRDIAGGMTCDIAVRSRLSGENRIYIEVKRTQPIGYGKVDSQVVRYFLHLLGTTHREPIPRTPDMRRAMILAAPPGWFATSANAETWSYFWETFAPLAAVFDVTLAELHLQDESLSFNKPMQSAGSAGG